MAIQELHIKNMVCDRCVRAVRQELERQGYVVRHLELGRATVERDLIELAALEKGLEDLGFELLTDRNARVVNQIKTLIIELIQSGQVATLHITLSDYISRQMAMDYAHLSHIFSTTEHLTIERFWIMQRVERAKELLSYRELTISDIASQLGYSSLSYLSNQFKQITGMTPATYRNLNAPDRNSLDWI
ncbi:transcriptional regulator, AraC family (plasmid) [Fibrisoma limi BUZ 3]|uniref:Transcriptional regulator, AraC family n=1 Tax=Fibrisoma limi BUZ 3 TaxID=1185876 RepID=I2GU64_9BACT|nr:helix-turn-helix domain-containing protein [Fibrisoma limi]CCH57665.1 transcriptional regulator, AraC family [Fibrisoma limi BUZ 3]